MNYKVHHLYATKENNLNAANNFSLYYRFNEVCIQLVVLIRFVICVLFNYKMIIQQVQIIM